MNEFCNKTKSHCHKCGRRSRSQNQQLRCHHGHLLKRKRDTDILFDQLIEVQQLNNSRCKSYKLQRVQQMVYLREKINNLTYREIHFPNEYIILKRLEEKNQLIHQNHFKVDQFFRSLKLQYQTMSTLHKNIPITSFVYSKDEETQITDSNESSTISDPIDSSIIIKPQQQYSQNANPSLIKSKKQNLEYDTAVIIDVTKYPQTTRSQSIIQKNYNEYLTHTTWNIPMHQELSPIYPYPQFVDIHQSDSFFTNNNHLSPIENTTQVVNKIKEILNTLQKNLLNQSILMTTDSLIMDTSIQTTYSQLDSLNENYFSSIKLLNPAKNINRNYQTTEEDNQSESQSNQSITVQYMSSSFMFSLQILLLTCLLNQFLIYYFFGILPSDILASIIDDNSPSVTLNKQ